MSEWRPIDSAPKPPPENHRGPDFLAYQDGMIVVGHYWDCAGSVYFSMSHVGGYEFEEEVTKPTHWMPLPEPPAS